MRTIIVSKPYNFSLFIDDFKIFMNYVDIDNKVLLFA